MGRWLEAVRRDEKNTKTLPDRADKTDETSEKRVLSVLSVPSSGVSEKFAAGDVPRLLDAMAAENERRRDWHTQPVEGWREGRLELRSAATGEATIIHFPNRRARP